MIGIAILSMLACGYQGSKALQEVWYEKCLVDSILFKISVPSYSCGCKDLALKIEEIDPTFFHADSKIKEDILDIKLKQSQAN